MTWTDRAAIYDSNKIASDSADSFAGIEEKCEQLLGSTNFPCTVKVHERSALTSSEWVTIGDSRELSPWYNIL